MRHLELEFLDLLWDNKSSLCPQLLILAFSRSDNVHVTLLHCVCVCCMCLNMFMEEVHVYVYASTWNPVPAVCIALFFPTFRGLRQIFFTEPGAHAFR